jgi:hypothetical protein
MLLYMLPLSTSRLTRMMQQSPTCWLYSGSEELWLQTPETERLWVRVAATGVVEAEDEEVQLEAELMPEVSGEDWEADSQNCGGQQHQQKPPPCRVPQPGRQL